jgi:hypothetical protein
MEWAAVELPLANAQSSGMPTTHAEEIARALRVSLELHRAVAERIACDPGVLRAARARVQHWRASGTVHPDDVERWATLLDGPREALTQCLVDPSEEAAALRQVSPFAGAIGARERWSIWRAAWRGASSNT